ncbi:STAS domain-containing protein [Streptomyces sp. NPDC056534]|uniref:STAS domain-containing protein n=1 Tax=Streptomyces sp. NPDC056534 TaxID=3345857 RepID=UPI0036941941
MDTPPPPQPGREGEGNWPGLPGTGGGHASRRTAPDPHRLVPRHRRTAPDRRTRPRHRPLLHQAATTALSTRPRHLDLAGLTFCDHTGLRALHQLTHQAHTAHASLHLTGLHPRLHHTLTQHPPTPSPRTPPVQHN